MSSVVVKKEFILTDIQFKEISNYIQGLSPNLFIDDFRIEYEGFKWIIKFLGDINNRVKIICSLYKKNKIYESSYALLEGHNIYNVFRQDTKFKKENTLKKETKEDVELYFTFNIKNYDKDYNYYLNIIKSIKVQGSFTNAVGMSYYYNFDNDIDLFMCLYALLLVKGNIGYYYLKYNTSKKEDLTYSNLEFIKNKLNYYGYNQDYIYEYDKISFTNIYHALGGKDLASKEIFEYFMVCTLKLLLHQQEWFLLEDDSQFFKFANDYFLRLKLEGKIL